MIERYGEISDGKRFHAIQRDTNGQWVRYDDHAQNIEEQRLQYINLIANRCAAFGNVLPEGLTFNAAVENLIKAVQSAEREKSADVVVRLRKSSQTLLTMNAPIAATLTQEAADEIERLREKVESYPKRN